MTAQDKPVNGIRRLGSALLRLAAAIVYSPGFACHTPSGPGCLVTGQHGAVGRGGCGRIAADAGRQSGHKDRIRPASEELSAPA